MKKKKGRYKMLFPLENLNTQGTLTVNGMKFQCDPALGKLLSMKQNYHGQQEINCSHDDNVTYRGIATFKG